MFPGYRYAVSAAFAASENPGVFFPKAAANFAAKCSARGRMASLRAARWGRNNFV